MALILLCDKCSRPLTPSESPVITGNLFLGQCCGKEEGSPIGPVVEAKNGNLATDDLINQFLATDTEPNPQHRWHRVVTGPNNNWCSSIRDYINSYNFGEVKAAWRRREVTIGEMNFIFLRDKHICQLFHWSDRTGQIGTIWIGIEITGDYSLEEQLIKRNLL
jgi:hypothetical protein